MKNEKVLKARGMQVSVVSDGGYDNYISWTNIAKYKIENLAASIQNWVRSLDVIEFWNCGRYYIIQILDSANSKGEDVSRFWCIYIISEMLVGSNSRNRYVF